MDDCRHPHPSRFHLPAFKFSPRRRVGILFAACLLLPTLASAADLDAKLRALLAAKEVQDASVGVSIVEITPQGPVQIFDHNARQALAPASCTKLVTTAAAFLKYGPHAHFKTQLYASAAAEPDLTLVGSGDPGLGDAKIAESRHESLTAPFDAWADTLKQRGLIRVHDLLIDDRVFDTQFIHESWPTANGQRLAWYEAPVGGLNFNVNCLDWMAKLAPTGAVRLELIPPTTYATVAIKAKRASDTQVWMYRGEPGTEAARRFELRGTVAASMTQPESVTIDDPGLWTGTVLKDRLAAAGITLTGSVKRLENPAADRGQLIGEAKTELIEIIRRAHKNSINMMAEALCKRLGYDAAVAAGKLEPGSWANGTAAVQAFVQSLGLPREQIILADGSGLSADDRIAPAVLTAVLARVAAARDGDLFIDSLAIPGDDGTLKKRFRNNPALAQAIHAKTGHIKGVSALTGYLDASRRRFAFSIVVNNSKFPSDLNLWEEKLVQALHDSVPP